ncbi:uncharacterized protein LOC135958752 [Calliphora vicina]|uniref:uncharacterized protein LOC135958752 n=1 Tax=Calliphora vicina TaxID=7373 RepID=UPI00325BA5FF
MALSIQIDWFNYRHYKIMDVPEKLHNQVQQFMLEHFRSYRLFQALKIQQEAEIEKDFLKIVKHILHNECSIMVVDGRNNNIKGLALLKCMTQEWRSWTALQIIIENERFKELCDLVQWCLQQQFLKILNNPGGDTLHLFSFHLCKDLEQDEKFMFQFFQTICEVARHMNLQRVTYLCLSQSDRACLQSAGFAEIVRIIYSMYVFKGRRPFDRLRDINEMYGGFYEKKVEPLKPFQDMIVRHVKGKEIKEIPKKLKEDSKQEKKETEND